MSENDTAVDGVSFYSTMKIPGGTRIFLSACIAGIRFNMTGDEVHGQELDTQIEMYGDFCVPGPRRKEFLKKFSDLINEYRA